MKFKVLCILFAVTYLYIIGQGIVSEIIPGIKMSIEEGLQVAKNKAGERKKPEFFFFYAQPTNGYYTFPTPMQNQKTEESIDTEMRRLQVKIYNPDFNMLPPWVKVLKYMEGLLGLILIAIAVYIPIETFKVIRSLVKDEIFDEKNIKRIRRTGYALLVCFAVSSIYAFSVTVTAQSLISLENYKIVYNLGDDIMILMFGFAVLLFAEILKAALKMKVENDLTV